MYKLQHIAMLYFSVLWMLKFSSQIANGQCKDYLVGQLTNKLPSEMEEDCSVTTTRLSIIVKIWLCIAYGSDYRKTDCSLWCSCSRASFIRSAATSSSASSRDQTFGLHFICNINMIFIWCDDASSSASSRDHTLQLMMMTMIMMMLLVILMVVVAFCWSCWVLLVISDLSSYQTFALQVRKGN